MYTTNEIIRITQDIFDIVECTNATLFDGGGLPICPRFEHLTKEQKETAFEGMQVRIEREGLQNYIERKRGAWGTSATEAVIEHLLTRGLLRE